MKLALFVHVCCSLCFAITTLAISLSKPGCPEKCGNITIPYPFGVGPECSANSSFTVICQNSIAGAPTVFLSSIKMEAMNISLLGTVTVNLPVPPINCSDVKRTRSLPISLEGSPFTISARYNSLVISPGCRKNSVSFRFNETTKERESCTAFCDANSTAAGCNGVNCCKITIPPRLKKVRYTYQNNEASNNGFCGYVFPADNKWLATYFTASLLPYFRSNPIVPLVLEWEFGRLKGLSNDTCKYADDYCLTYPDHDYGSRYFNDDTKYHSYDDCRRRNGDTRGYYYDRYTNYYNRESSEYVSPAKYCSCPRGYKGNPYLPQGCTDIDECSNSAWNRCQSERACINKPGSYECQYDESNKFDVRTALISIGSSLGALVLLIVAWKSNKVVTNLILASRKYMYFKRNGGLLLEQHVGGRATLKV